MDKNMGYGLLRSYGHLNIPYLLFKKYDQMMGDLLWDLTVKGDLRYNLSRANIMVQFNPKNIKFTIITDADAQMIFSDIFKFETGTVLFKEEKIAEFIGRDGVSIYSKLHLDYSVFFELEEIKG